MTARGLVMQLDLSVLELLLSWVETGFVQGLNGILNVSPNVSCLIHSAIGTDAKNARQLNPVRKQMANSVFWAA